MQMKCKLVSCSHRVRCIVAMRRRSHTTANCDSQRTARGVAPGRRAAARLTPPLATPARLPPLPALLSIHGTPVINMDYSRFTRRTNNYVAQVSAFKL